MTTDASTKWVAFYFDRWIAGTDELTPEERGVLITLCARMWSTGDDLNQSDSVLARWCGCGTKRFRRVLARLIETGKITVEMDENGRFLTNERAKKEGITAKLRSTAAVERSKNAAKKRWKKQPDTAENRQTGYALSIARGSPPSNAPSNAITKQNNNPPIVPLADPAPPDGTGHGGALPEARLGPEPPASTSTERGRRDSPDLTGVVGAVACRAARELWITRRWDGWADTLPHDQLPDPSPDQLPPPAPSLDGRRPMLDTRAAVPTSLGAVMSRQHQEILTPRHVGNRPRNAIRTMRAQSTQELRTRWPTTTWSEILCG